MASCEHATLFPRNSVRQVAPETRRQMNYIVGNVPEISRACRAFNGWSHLVTSTRNSRATFAYSLASALSSRELSRDPALLAARVRFSILSADFCLPSEASPSSDASYFIAYQPFGPDLGSKSRDLPFAPSAQRKTRLSLSLILLRGHETTEFNCHPLRPFDSLFDLRFDSATLRSRLTSRPSEHVCWLNARLTSGKTEIQQRHICNFIAVARSTCSDIRSSYARARTWSRMARATRARDAAITQRRRVTQGARPILIPPCPASVSPGIPRIWTRAGGTQGMRRRETTKIEGSARENEMRAGRSRGAAIARRRLSARSWKSDVGFSVSLRERFPARFSPFPS